MATATDWQSAEGRFILYRLLAVAPWDSTVAAGVGDSPLAAALGLLFEQTNAKPHRLRALAHAWVRWAGRTLLRLNDAWFGVRRSGSGGKHDDFTGTDFDDEGPHDDGDDRVAEEDWDAYEFERGFDEHGRPDDARA